VDSFTTLPLYPGERVPGTHWVEGWVGPRAGLDGMLPPGLELRTLGSPSRSQSLSRPSHVDNTGSRPIVLPVFIICVTGNMVFSLLHVVQTGSGVHPTSYPMGTGGSFPGVKRPGRESDHSPPTTAEVKKMWIYTSTPPYAFMA
jgi:hypothetical protein